MQCLLIRINVQVVMLAVCGLPNAVVPSVQYEL
jgi:hypothetical protein